MFLLFSFWWMLGCYLGLSPDEVESLPEVDLNLVDGIDLSYDGRFAWATDFLDLKSRIFPMRERALRTVHDRTGLPLVEQGRIALTFADAPEAIGGSCRAVRSGDREIVLVTLAAGPLALGWIDAEATLTHELTHAVLRVTMGNQRYLDLPLWIREGLAIWGARQLRERVEGLVAAALLDGADLGEILDRLNDPHRADPYLAEALMFEYLEQNHGLPVVQGVVGDLAAGQAERVAFEQNTGFSWEALLDRRDQFSTMYVEGTALELLLDPARQVDQLRIAGRPGLPLGWVLVERWCQRRDQVALTVRPSSETARFPQAIDQVREDSSWLSRVCAWQTGVASLP
jgi:hypothetical protein